MSTKLRTRLRNCSCAASSVSGHSFSNRCTSSRSYRPASTSASSDFISALALAGTGTTDSSTSSDFLNSMPHLPRPSFSRSFSSLGR